MCVHARVCVAVCVYVRVRVRMCVSLRTCARERACVCACRVFVHGYCCSSRFRFVKFEGGSIYVTTVNKLEDDPKKMSFWALFKRSPESEDCLVRRGRYYLRVFRRH